MSGGYGVSVRTNKELPHREPGGEGSGMVVEVGAGGKGSCMPNRPDNPAVIDLVLEAILKWVSARGGLIVPSRVVPWVTVNSPWGVRRSTTAPGTRSSLAVVSTMVCSAAWSIGLSADELGREHPAIRRATPSSKLASARIGNSNVILPMINVAGVPLFHSGGTHA